MATSKNDFSRIRSCLPEDCALLAPLLQATDLYEPTLDNEASFQKKIAHDPDSIIVIEKAGVIIGMVITIFDPWVSSLWHLAIHPEFQRQGYGRALAREAEKRLITRGATSVIGYVRTENTPSRKLFHIRGWNEYPMNIIPIEKKF